MITEKEAGILLYLPGTVEEVQNRSGEDLDQAKSVLEKMRKLMEEKNLIENGLHHEIYLSDSRRVPEEKMKAIETAKEVQKMDARSAKWIASDAIRELTSQAVQERLQRKR